MNQTLTNEIAALVESVSKRVKMGPDGHSKPFKDLGVDSLEIANMFLLIAEKYGIDVPDAEIDRLDTVDAVVGYLENHRGQQ